MPDLLLDRAADAPDAAARALRRLPRGATLCVPLQVVQVVAEEHVPDVPLLRLAFLKPPQYSYYPPVLQVLL